MSRCTATLRRRGVLLHCSEYHHRKDENPTHRAEASDWVVYWSDGETVREQCPATATYCGEALRCDEDAGRRCRNGHGAQSVRYGAIHWSDEKRPQPQVMFTGLQMGHMYGSREADSMMVAAATMQDAVNRLELLRPPSPAERAFLLTVEQHGLGPGVGECQEAWAAVVEERER